MRRFRNCHLFFPLPECLYPRPHTHLYICDIMDTFSPLMTDWILANTYHLNSMIALQTVPDLSTTPVIGNKYYIVHKSL